MIMMMPKETLLLTMLKQKLMIKKFNFRTLIMKKFQLG